MKKRFIGDLFLHSRWYTGASVVAFLFLFSFFIPLLWDVSVIALIVMATVTLIDYLLLFGGRHSVQARRELKERLHLGHENDVRLYIGNTFRFPVQVVIIDELPVQFQQRDFRLATAIGPGGQQSLAYRLQPKSRGVYTFGRILCYVRSPLGLLQRRCVTAAGASVKVYPSVRQLRQYQLMAVSDTNTYAGSRKMRRVGHSMEFEQIKDYVQGDDIRSINWKATARRGGLMVNNFTDARSQQVYCILDKGRAMKMPFDGMTLLDHAINASLIFLNIALLKQDRGGLITFSSKVNDIIAADRSPVQLNKLQEALYLQETDFADSDYEALTTAVYHKLSHRSFLMLFTNFETMASLERQLPYLRRLASRHLVCVILFQNTLLKTLREDQPDTLEGIYIQTIADRFDFEKKQIVKALRRYGILSVLTTPEALTVDVVNKYVELKSRQMI